MVTKKKKGMHMMPDGHMMSNSAMKEMMTGKKTSPKKKTKKY